jgi:hypothetical protein
MTKADDEQMIALAKLYDGEKEKRLRLEAQVSHMESELRALRKVKEAAEQYIWNLEHHNGSPPCNCNDSKKSLHKALAPFKTKEEK